MGGFWLAAKLEEDRFEWESILEEDLFTHINRGDMNKESKDHLVWGGDTTGVFSVKLIYVCLANQINSPTDGAFFSLWQAKAMPKDIITGWRILLDKIPTSINLFKRGVTVNSTICALCRESEESTQHLFLDCVIAQRVWFMCFRCLGVLFVQHKELKCHFENFYLIHMSLKHNQVWKGM